MVLLDTNVVSELRSRTPNGNVRIWYAAVDDSALFLSVLTLGEIAKGADLLKRRDPDRRLALLRWLDDLRELYRDRLLAVDSAVATTWGSLSAERPLPAIDGLLAATALVHGLTLATRNVRDFTGLGVAIINPWEG